MSDILKLFGVAIKSVFSRSACDMYPKKPATVYENTRGHVAIEEEKCILCSLCAKKCPTNAIQVLREERKWIINHYRCIYCNNCITACPPKCLKMKNQYVGPATEQSVETHPIPEKVKETK